jgi:8-oxo-dGTP diphosphatase
MIEVSCAIIIDDSKILAVQRGPESSHSLEWEFPGGKIQPNETAEQGVVREIEEELSIRIELLGKLEPIDFDYGIKQIKLIPFVCRVIKGEILLTEHVAKRWFDLNNWNTLNWCGADSELILQNQEKLNQLIWENRI